MANKLQSDSPQTKIGLFSFFLLKYVAWLVFMMGVLPIITTLTIVRKVQAFEEFSASSFNPSAMPSDISFSISVTSTVYLPLITKPDDFVIDLPIWAHSSDPASHEVVLFRRTFILDQELQNTTLFIFADTRYEVWIDGTWVGRGPARFSRKTREYDIYQLGKLQPGVHLIAVLVQWAPNQRRSESITPFLQAHIQGTTKEGFRFVVRTDTRWKALLSDAWQRDAVSVHAWGLIGPTELVDLRQISPNWMLPSFSDNEWPNAVVKTIPNANYRPRSIPPLENELFVPTVIDAGLLSPGRVIGELAPPVTDPYLLPFNVLNTTVFTVEVLSNFTNTVRVDNSDLVWQKGESTRPDVYIATTTLASGPHFLSFTDIPPHGLTFAISTHNVQFRSGLPPFQQGLHAGRRLLLAELVSQPNLVTVSSEDYLNLKFTKLPAYAVLDVGRVVHGRLAAQVVGPPGTIIDIGWDERLWMGFRPLPYPGTLHEQWNQTDSWILDGSKRSISTLDTRAGRYILIAVWGEGPVQLQNIRIYEERYPVIQRGNFTSSNALLNKIWQTGVNTLYPNMTDAYTDTPWRERGQWWGDAYVEDHINRVSFGDTKLLKRGLLFMAEAFTEGRPTALAPNGNNVYLLDYGMLWVHSLKEYWTLTEDSQLLNSVYPVLRDFMRYLESYETSTGLLDIPFGHWSETALIDWPAYTDRYGMSTAINALYYKTLVNAADLAEKVGDFANALLWRHKASSVKRQINTFLFIPTEHQYVASIVEGKTSPPSPHAQAWALANGVVREEETDQVVFSLLELLSSDPASPNVEVYGMFWVLKALGDMGYIPEALNIIESYYGRMLKLGATTWWEGFNAHLKYTASLSHGWGGSPTWFLTTYVLGGRQTGPTTWQVKPAFMGVNWASGSLPLQNGELQIFWKRQDCEDSSLHVTSPSGTTGEIIVPFLNTKMTLLLNGELIWKDGIPQVEGVSARSDGIYIPVRSGFYDLHVQQECYSIFLPLTLR